MCIASLLPARLRIFERGGYFAMLLLIRGVESSCLNHPKRIIRVTVFVWLFFCSVNYDNSARLLSQFELGVRLLRMFLLALHVLSLRKYCCISFVYLIHICTQVLLIWLTLGIVVMVIRRLTCVFVAAFCSVLPSYGALARHSFRYCAHHL